MFTTKYNVFIDVITFPGFLIAGIGVQKLVEKLGTKSDPRKFFRACCIIAIVLHVLFYVTRRNGYLGKDAGEIVSLPIGILTVIFTGLTAIPLECKNLMQKEMEAETVDYVEWKTGTRVEGVMLSLMSFTGKIEGSVSSAIGLGILRITGYIVHTEGSMIQNAETNKALFFMTTLLPAIGYALMLIGMEHHLLYPHISPLITDNGTCCKKHEMYIEKFAEAGMRFLFVGHSHIQRIDKYVSGSGKELYEINVGSLVGYPAPIVTLTADDDTVKIETRNLSGFTYNGEKYTSRYFEIHAQNLVGRILSSAKSSDKEFYIKDMREYGMGRKTALKLRPVLKALACTADKMTVKTLGKIINAVTLGTTFSNSDLDELADKRIIDIVNEQLLSVLDGSCVKHPEGSAYYNAVTGFVGLPDRAVKRLKIKDEKINRLTSSLNTAIREILTGGDLDNETLTVKR